MSGSAGAASLGGSSAGQTSGGGGADAAGSTGSAGSSSSGSGGGGASGDGPQIPAAPASCPTIATGIITVLGQQVRLWTGPAGSPGPLVFYWHGTGGEPEEALYGVGAGLDEIVGTGGVVASFSTTTGQDTNTGNKVWYTGDFEMADVILACGVAQGLVDARQVFTAGCSAGGLQASVMLYGRSSYLAAAAPNSGGVFRDWPLEDPAHVPALITTHGGAQDFVQISFPEATATLTADVASQGGFVVNCDHGGEHCASPESVKVAQWQFMKAHPFGVTPDPYAAGVPPTFPAFCQIVP